MGEERQETMQITIQDKIHSIQFNQQMKACLSPHFKIQKLKHVNHKKGVTNQSTQQIKFEASITVVPFLLTA